jgi:hypothetical protein
MTAMFVPTRAGTVPSKLRAAKDINISQRLPRSSAPGGGRGLHSSTFWLNVSAFCGIGGAIRGCLGDV